MTLACRSLCSSCDRHKGGRYRPCLHVGNEETVHSCMFRGCCQVAKGAFGGTCFVLGKVGVASDVIVTVPLSDQRKCLKWQSDRIVRSQLFAAYGTLSPLPPHPSKSNLHPTMRASQLPGLEEVHFATHTFHEPLSPMDLKLLHPIFWGTRHLASWAIEVSHHDALQRGNDLTV